MTHAAQSRLIIEPASTVSGVLSGGAWASSKKVMRLVHQKYGYASKKRNPNVSSHTIGKEKSQRGRSFGAQIRRGGAVGHHRLKYKTHKA